MKFRKEKLRKLDRDKYKQRTKKERRHSDDRLDEIRRDKEKQKNRRMKKENKDRIKLEEQRKNRTSKGQNAYASGSSSFRKVIYFSKKIDFYTSNISFS